MEINGSREVHDVSKSQLELNGSATLMTGHSKHLFAIAHFPGASPGSKCYRILICGSVEGDFIKFAEHLRVAVKAQGPFSLALCCGAFFANDSQYTLEMLQRYSHEHAERRNNVPSNSSDADPNIEYCFGVREFPLPVAFVDSSFSSIGSQLRTQYPDGYNLTKSLRFLGACGITTLGDLKVAFLSGRYNCDSLFAAADEEESVNLSDDGVESTGPGSDDATKDGDQTRSPTASDHPSADRHCTPGDYPPQISKNVLFTGPHKNFYCLSLVQKMKRLAVEAAGSVDVFLSCEWPSDLERTLSLEQRTELLLLQQERGVANSPALSEISELLEPRFHVGASAAPLFYQRPFWRSTKHKFAVRFIGLGTCKGAVKGDKSTRYIHALVLESIATVRQRGQAALELLRGAPNTCPSSPFFDFYNPASDFGGVEQDSSSPENESGTQGPGRGRKRVRRFSSAPSASPALEQQAPTSEQAHFQKLDNQVNRDAGSEQHSDNSNGNSKRLRLEKSKADPSTQSGSVGGVQPASTSTVSSPGSSPLRVLRALVNARTGTNSSPINQTGDFNRVNDNSGSLSATSTQATSSIQPSISEEPSSTVQVSQLPVDLDQQGFMDVMNAFGPVKSVEFSNSPNGHGTKSAWVVFETLEGSARAVAASGQLRTNSHSLVIRYHDAGRVYPSRVRPGLGHHSNRTMDYGARGALPYNPSPVPRRAGPPATTVNIRPHSSCWFCLSNPKCEKRLVVSCGKHVYVALAKGGLVHQHVLLVPVTHYPNFVFCPPDVGAELETFVTALRRCYSVQEMETIVFERYFPMRSTTGMHMQLQIIPVARNFAHKASELFSRRTEALNAGEPDIFGPNETMRGLRRRIVDQVNQPYFYAELPGSTPGSVQRLLYVREPGKHLPLPFNFGREVAATILEAPERADWRACVEPVHVEAQLARQMANLFTGFEPRGVEDPLEDSAASLTFTGPIGNGSHRRPIPLDTNSGPQ